MAINWFPGHMNRARREIGEAIKKADVVVELVDARLPRSSRNPLLAELRGDRPVLLLLTKSDLADPDVTRDWLSVLAPDHPRAVSLTDPRAARSLPKRIRALAPNRGGPGRTLRTLVVGIPNVGKSTLINALVGRKVAKTGDQPAITRHPQRVELDTGLSVYDTPGVLWPKLADQAGARRLAASGAIRDTAIELYDIACFAATFLAERYPEALAARYDLDALEGEPLVLLEAIGRRRGALLSGGRVDLERAADTLLRELRAGKLGPISFERPEDFDDEAEPGPGPAQASR